MLSDLPALTGFQESGVHILDVVESFVHGPDLISDENCGFSLALYFRSEQSGSNHRT